MRGTLAIAWKDLRLIITSPTFFIIAGLCSVIWSYNYLWALIVFAAQSGLPAQFGGNPNMNVHYNLFIQHISYVNIIFIFAVPAITMRLLAEEKKLRTYDLLLTAPVSATGITLGKFLAGFGAVMSLVLISFLYPLATTMVASFPMGPLLTSYVGLSLVAGAYVAVGLFASSLTESVVLSVTMGVIFNLILWFVSQGAETTDGPMARAVLEHLSIGQHFFSFLKGTFTTSSIIFFISCMALFVFLSQRVVESSRWR